MSEQTFPQFKAGDRVWEAGWGETVLIASDTPGWLRSACSQFNYLLDGRKYTRDTQPSIFHLPFVIPPEPVRRPDFKVDDPVEVRMSCTDFWYRRYFAGWSHDGKIRCFDNGATSWSNSCNKSIATWGQYRIPEPPTEQPDGR